MPDEDERQVPSGIVSACQFQAKWLVAMGLVFLSLSATAPLWLLHHSERIQLLTEALHRPATLLPQRMNLFAGVCAFLALANAFCLFYCATGLRYFADSRLVLDLHSAMRRLRLVWCVFAITVILVAGAVIAASLTGMLRAIP
jgi:hypothetical protein